MLEKLKYEKVLRGDTHTVHWL